MNDINKETGLPWIGVIPKNWSLIRGKFLFNKLKEINKDLKCKNLLSLTYDGVLNKNFHSNEGLRPREYNTYQLFKKDDLVFKMIDLENIKTSRVGIVHEYGIMSSAYIRFEPHKEKIYPKFAYWFYYDLYKKEIYNSIGSGVRSTLSSDDLSEIELPVPAIKEQKIISSYIDKKTSQIDSLIKNIKNKKTLIKEAIISHLYELKFKDLKINAHPNEWFKALPESWKIIKFRELFEQINIKNNPDGERLLSVTQDKGVVYRHEQDKNVVNPEGEISSYKLVEPGDFIISLRSADGGLEASDVRGLVSPAYIVLRPKMKIDMNFYRFLLTSENFIIEMRRYIKGIRDGKNIYFDDIKDVLIPFFPISSWDKEHERVVRLHQDLFFSFVKFEKKIRLLEEYRKSLISCAITGKIRITEKTI